MGSSSLEISLSHGTGELGRSDPAFQQEVNKFAEALRSADVSFSQRVMTFDSVHAVGFPLGEFTIDMAKVLAPAVTAIVVAWIKYRPGRKVTIKRPGLTVTAENPEDAESILDKIRVQQTKEPTVAKQ